MNQKKGKVPIILEHTVGIVKKDQQSISSVANQKGPIAKQAILDKSRQVTIHKLKF